MTSKRAERSQSAMEYLMTYGWAILAIAVAFAVLFELQIFNFGNQGSAQPGSCRVTSNGGPLSFVGVCNGALPKFVPDFSNGGYVSVANLSGVAQDPESGYTISEWVEISKSGGGPEYTLNTSPFSAGYVHFSMIMNASGTGDIEFLASSPGAGSIVLSPANVISAESQWYYVVGVKKGSYVALYVNGQLSKVGGSIVSGPHPSPTTVPILIGAAKPGVFQLLGSISNIQIYNRPLSANEISVLYGEGIGGLPIDVSHLAAWYPLNGNPNDYSIFQENGVPTNVVYSSTWLSNTKLP